ncbi:tape measure protein [Xenophilus sp. Marseille-Q4582]|uniref:tape measure protein n=1 Tax=Xenophilus sp. Marseille-Q4582 TaxID=2866600 RepID=UPI001CE42298|nr:tape measure protein [Xenophilus sp. Marseille-Q4582]
MTENVANIGVKVDTSDADRGVKSLEALAAAGPKVERALDGVEGAAKKTGKSLDSLGVGAGKGLEDVGKKTKPASDGLNKVTDSANKATKATKDLGAINITGLTRLNTSAAEAATSAKAMASSMSVASAGMRGMGTASSSAERGMRSFASAADATANALRAEATALGGIRTSVATVGAAHLAAAQQTLALSGAVQALTVQTAALATSSAAAAAAMQRFSASSQQSAPAMRATGVAAAETQASFMALTRIGIGAFLGSAVVQSASAAAKSLYEASAAGERLRMTLNFATGGQGARELAYVTKLADDLGLQLASTAKAYASFSAAAKGTAIEGQATREIFESISKASAVMGLSAEQSAGALLALQQMVSKGTVQAEELRGQLGERLPGAFQVAAKAMGVTTAELGKMLEQGQVIADDFLPKFARALNEHLGGAADKAADRLDAAVNRFDNAWERLKRSAGDSGVTQALAGGVQAATNDLNAVSEAFDNAKKAGDGMFSAFAKASGVAIGRTFFDTIGDAASVVNGSLNVLSGGFLKLRTDVSQQIMPRMLMDSQGAAQSLDKDLAAAEKSLANLKAQGAATSPNIYLRSAYADAQSLVDKLREARAAMAATAGVQFSYGDGDSKDSRMALLARNSAVVSSYLGDTSRQSKAQQQSAAETKAKTEYEKAYAAAVGDTAKQLKVKAAYEVELANIAEKYKDKGGSGGGAAELKKQATAYRDLIGSIAERIEAERQELAGGEKLSASAKARIKFEQDLKEEKFKLTEAQRAGVVAYIDEWAALEKSNAAAKERARIDAELEKQAAATVDAAWKSADGIRSAAEAQEFANRTFGMSKSSVAELTLEQMKLNLAQLDGSDRVLPGYVAALQAAIDQQQRLVQGLKIGEQNDIGGAALKELQDFLDPTKAEDFGDALRDAFAGASKALGGMSGAVNKAVAAIDRYGKRSAQIAKQEQNAATALVTGRQKAWEFQDSIGKINEEREKNNQAALRDTLGIFGDLTGAAKSFFEEQSSGYKTLQVVSATFHAAELAMTVQKLVPQAISAVLGQGQGDPYSAFARMAAMAAFVASLGVSLGGGGGGGGGGGYTGIKSGGTGTVLGMEGQQSESLGNAIDILADNSKIELAYTQKMLSELTKVREGIQGLAGTASTDFFIRGFAGASFGDAFLDSGIGFFPGQTVADIIEKGVQGMGFNLIFDKGAQAMWRNLDEEFTTGVGRVLANVAETVYTAADALGLNDAALQERMLSLIPTLGDTSTYMQNGMFGMQGGGLVSLKDMTGEEIQKELEAIFSAVGDQMAAAALPALRPFQAIGEGMFETLIKVTTGIETAEYALEKFGLRAIDYTDIVRKQGDVAVEIMRQTIMGAEQELAMYRYGTAGSIVSSMTPQSGLSSIIETFVGDASELEDLYASLLDVRSAMKSVGLQALDLSRDMIRGAGGLENLQSGFDSYFENFFSEQEQLEAKTARLTEEFQRIGIAMPVGVQGFRSLVESIDTGTEAGQYLTGQLMGVADAFYEVASASGQAALSLADIVADMVGRASDFLTPGQMQALSVQRIQSTLAAGGVNASFEQILGYSRQQFANDIQAYYAAGNETMVRLMHSIADDYLSISQSTVDALQAQQQEASQTVSALQADVDKWTSMRKSAQDLSRSIGLSITGGTGEAELWATVNGTGDLDARIKAATELKGIIERSASVQMQAWQTALSSAQSLLTVGKQLKSYVDSLKVGSLSALTPAEQMGEALRQYEETLAKARGGDKDAQGALQNIANSYLTLAQNYSPGMYTAIFDTVTKQLDALGGSLVSEAQAEVNRQQALISAAEAANGLSAEQIAKLTTLQSAVDSMVATADVKITTTNAELAIANAKLSSVESLLASVNDVWTYLPEQQAGMFDGGVNRIIEALVGLPKEFARNIAAVVGVDVSTVPGFASGGVHSGGWRIVGERGPELEFTAPSRIYSNGQSSQMLAQANAELVAEVRALRAEMAAVKAEVARSGDKAAMASLEGGQRTAAAVERGIEKGARGNALAKRAVAA